MKHLTMDERMARLAEIDPGAYVHIRGPINHHGESVWEKQSGMYEQMQAAAKASGFDSLTHVIASVKDTPQPDGGPEPQRHWALSEPQPDDGDVPMMTSRELAKRIERGEKWKLADTQPDGGDIYEAYMSWPDDIRKKLSMHDLRRMSGWAPKTSVDDWAINTQAGGPILTYRGCSVIEGEDARYLLGLIAKDVARPDVVPQPDGGDGAVAWYVFADTEHWVTLDRDKAEENRSDGCQVRPLIFGDTRPSAAAVVDDIRNAAQALATRLRQIHDDPLYRAVWDCAFIHGIDYSKGPKYNVELEALDAALATPRAEQEDK